MTRSRPMTFLASAVVIPLAIAAWAAVAPRARRRAGPARFIAFGAGVGELIADKQATRNSRWGPAAASWAYDATAAVDWDID